MNKSFDYFHVESAMSHNARFLQGNIDNYLNWNLSVFPIKKNRNILDLGCGPGLYFHAIMRYSPSLYVAADYSDRYLDEIRALFNNRPNCKALHLDLMAPIVTQALTENCFDYVFCFDVLEHLEDDEQALKNIYMVMKATSSEFLFLRIPALQCIYGKNDEVIGHYRRYSLKSLKVILERCSLQVKLIRYQNILGVIPWYIIGTILKRKLAVSSKEGTLFNYIVPVIKFIESVIALPFGLSLYCICTIKN